MSPYLLKYKIHENISLLIIITVTIGNHYQYQERIKGTEKASSMHTLFHR